MGAICASPGGCVAVPLANGASCTDGDPCTVGDSCLSGACAPGSSCDDGDACTVDTCKGDACEHVPQIGLACDDGNACTDSDSCGNTGCAGVPVVCKACTADGPALCNPVKGCPVSTQSCDDGNPCTIDGCSTGVGCVATASSDVPCGSTKLGNCNAGVCSDCTTLNAVLTIPNKDLEIRGIEHSATGWIAVGRIAAQGQASGQGAVLIIDEPGKIATTVEVGDTDDDVLEAVVLIGSQYWAVGTQVDPKNNKPDALVVRFAASGAAQPATTVGGGGDEAFFAVTASAGQAIAVGAQNGKGWVVRLDAAGKSGDASTQVAPVGGTLVWNAVVPIGTDGSLLVAGTSAGPSGTIATLARLDKSLNVVWMKTVGTAGTYIDGLAASGSQLVAVGGESVAGIATPWVVSVDPTAGPGAAVKEPSQGQKYYDAAAFGLSGALAVVGGADETTPSGQLPAWGWFARWDNLSTGPAVARTVAAGATQHLLSMVAHKDHWVAAGVVTLTGSAQLSGWITELGKDGRPACLTP